MDDEKENQQTENEQLVSIQYLKTRYTGYPTPITQPCEIRGVVTANDRYGTFRQTLVVQDETGAVELKVSSQELAVDFHVGQPVGIRCQGLVLGGYGGVVSLGAVSRDGRYQNGWIDSELFATIAVHRGEIIEPLPREVTIPTLQPEQVSCFVAVRGVQFVEDEIGRAWCEPDRDTDRHLVDPQGNVLVVRTEYRSDFAHHSLPRESGYIEGILSSFNGMYQLRVISPKGAVMESPRFVPVGMR